MKHIHLKTEDNSIILSVGAGMFLWLAITSFLYTLLFTVSKYLLVILGVNPIFNYCLNETLYSILFIFITWRIFIWVRKEKGDNATAKKIFVGAIITFTTCQIVKFVASYYLYLFVGNNYYTQLIDYDEATRALANVVNLRILSNALEIFRDVGLALLIYIKVAQDK